MNNTNIISLLNKLKEKELDYQERVSLHNQIILNSKRYKEELCQAIENTQDIFFKIELLEIIGNTQNSYFEDEIVKIIKTESNIEVLQTAVTSLGKLGGLKSFDILINLLHHKNANVRLGAIYGLICLDNKQAVKYLLNCLDDHESAKCWWPSPKAGGYIINKEASIAIDKITGKEFKGDKKKIKKWLDDHF